MNDISRIQSSSTICMDRSEPDMQNVGEWVYMARFNEKKEMNILYALHGRSQWGARVAQLPQVATVKCMF